MPTRPARCTHLAGRTLVLLVLASLALPSGVPAAEEETSGRELRLLDPASPDYRTPRAGEGFRTHVFGRDVEVHFRDRRSTSAWDLGGALWLPAPEGRTAIGFGALYFWRRPDTDRFFRGTIALIDNDIVYARSIAEGSPFEVVLGFDSRTNPFASSERVDGERQRREQLLKGSVLGRVGIGYRRQVGAGIEGFDFRDEVDPQAPDNMFSVSLSAEPQYLYFDEGDDAADEFTAPQDTFQIDGHLELRWDAMERNLLDLLHRGFAVGLDARQGWRTHWEDWGIERRERAGGGRHPTLVESYLVLAGGVPLASERHRLVGSVHAGWGDEVDRFSSPSLGGGPSGNEFLSLARPVLPGASIGEFTSEHYVVGIAEYRYEVFFFTYLGPRASVSWIDRERLGPGGTVRRQDDLLTSVGARLTTGFLFETRLQLDYNYNFDVIRDGDRGANELVLHISGSF